MRQAIYHLAGYEILNKTVYFVIVKRYYFQIFEIFNDNFTKVALVPLFT